MRTRGLRPLLQAVSGVWICSGCLPCQGGFGRSRGMKALRSGSGGMLRKRHELQWNLTT